MSYTMEKETARYDHLETLGILLYRLEEVTIRDSQTEEQLSSTILRTQTIVSLLFDEMKEKRYVDQTAKTPTNYSDFLDLVIANVSNIQY